MTAVPVEAVTHPGPMSRTTSLQRMLDLEKQYRLERLKSTEPPVASPKAPAASQLALAPLQVRRADAQSQPDRPVSAMRRAATLPALSITIPPPKGQGRTGVDRQDAALSDWEAENDAQDREEAEFDDDGEEQDEDDVVTPRGDGEGPQKSVKFIGSDGEEMSDAESSICQSPSWEGYGQRKQKKKEEASKRKKEKEQADKDTRAAKKRLATRLSKNPPAASLSRPSSRTAHPAPLTERSLSAPIFGKRQLLEGPQRPSSRHADSVHDDGAHSITGPSFKVASLLFGGRKNESDKKPPLKRPMEMVSYVPLTYAVMGQVGFARTSWSKRLSVESMDLSQMEGNHSTKAARDAHPPSASRSYTLLNGTGPDRVRSSSTTPSLSGRRDERSSSKTRDRKRNKGSSSSSSYSQDSTPVTPVGNERGRSLSGGYVRQVREQSSDRAFSGFMDEQLVSMVNNSSNVKYPSIIQEPVAALKARLQSRSLERETDSTSAAAADLWRQQEVRSRQTNRSRQGGHKTPEPALDDNREARSKAEQLHREVQEEQSAGRASDDAINDYFGISNRPYVPPALDLVSPMSTAQAATTDAGDDARDRAVQDLSRSTSSLSPPPKSPSRRNALDSTLSVGNEPLPASQRTAASNKAGSRSSAGSQPSPRKSKPAGKREQGTGHDKDSVIHNQSGSSRSERKAKRGSSQPDINSANYTVPTTRAGTADTKADSHLSPTLPALSQRAASALELVRSTSQTDLLPSPLAPASSSTTALLGKRKSDLPSRRASSALAMSRQDEGLRIPSKAARLLGEFGGIPSQQRSAPTVQGKPIEGSSSSSSFDDTSSLPSPVSTPDTSRPQSQRGHSGVLSGPAKVENQATAVSEDEDDDGIILLQEQPTASLVADNAAHHRPSSVASKSRAGMGPEESWSRTALPIDLDAHSIYGDATLSKSKLVDVEIPLPPADSLQRDEDAGEEDEEEAEEEAETAQLESLRSQAGSRERYSGRAVPERTLSPDIRRQAASPPHMSRTRGSAHPRPQLLATDSADSGKSSSSSSSETGKLGPSKLRTTFMNSSSSSSATGYDSSASNASAAYLQEARRTAPNSSRNSSVGRPPHTGAPAQMSRPNLVNAPKSLPAPVSTAKPASVITSEQQRPIAKMLVECCNCHFFHDMPSRLYEFMASPDSIVEDRLLGVSGAITTMVKCPWCTHNMSTKCCSGYAAVVYLKEKLH